MTILRLLEDGAFLKTAIKLPNLPDPREENPEERLGLVSLLGSVAFIDIGTGAASGYRGFRYFCRDSWQQKGSGYGLSIGVDCRFLSENRSNRESNSQSCRSTKHYEGHS